MRLFVILILSLVVSLAAADWVAFTLYSDSASCTGDVQEIGFVNGSAGGASQGKFINNNDTLINQSRPIDTYVFK